MSVFKKVVIKVGTKVLTSADRQLDRARVEDIASQIAALKRKGVDVIVVTSGAIGAGMSVLNIKKRPEKLADLQATAAIGQNHLMSLYGGFLKKEGYDAGQILLTQEDFNDRQRYLNIKSTINTLLKHGAVPVINENDTVATEEIRCGDNDRLSSLVADLCGVDALVILTDVRGLLDEKGDLIRSVDSVTEEILKLGGKSHCDLGVGGMATKIEAARIVTGAGIECVIADGREKDVLVRIVTGTEAIGTVFRARKGKFIARKRWIAFSSSPKGSVAVDNGAKDAIMKKDRSLLASGILGVKGRFSENDVIGIADQSGREFARGIANYSSEELSRIRGQRTDAIKKILGYKREDEAVHKDNLAIL
jgi:glutamate 5-kinase